MISVPKRYRGYIFVHGEGSTPSTWDRVYLSYALITSYVYGQSEPWSIQLVEVVTTTTPDRNILDLDGGKTFILHYDPQLQIWRNSAAQDVQRLYTA